MEYHHIKVIKNAKFVCKHQEQLITHKIATPVPVGPFARLLVISIYHNQCCTTYNSAKNEVKRIESIRWK